MQVPSLDFGLGPDLDALRDAVREFAQGEIAPLAARIDREDRFPAPLWRQMGELGLLGITVPEAFGGSGLGYLAHMVAMEEISRASAAVGLSYAAHSQLCVNQILRHGSEEQKARTLPRLVSGEWVGALAMSEPQAGSDVLAMRLAARREGGDFVLDGTKMWITNGPDADLVLVYARTSGPGEADAIGVFLVERGTPGFSVAQRLDKLGMRGSATGELVFENCRVPAANLVGAVDGGVRILMSGLDFERAVLSAGPLGIMQACLDLVVPYVHERRQFGQPIGRFQLIEAKLADMYTGLSACRAYSYAVGRLLDEIARTRPSGHARALRKDCAGAILVAAEKATWMAGEAIQILGGNGYINDTPSGRLWRDAKLYEIGAGTSEIRRMLIGREIFHESE